ncbi:MULTISPECIES: IS1634 family transposase [Okeania]|uniref:IS1634 family transposase n=1 Tax=Okeania hirsuta TaxID=1458930 RepID=A0A3N6NER8_9CYAN|nr:MULTISPECIES: IS1634 family transposase [Okeania]NET13767.1 IS1634 family transposase [Okeania sp. SIO1H6]NES75683.1 IS1634 family transposase [Okeania sp. SIO1H4]NES88634.1 IS1634 family transposase [Okeania sp. SIO2B9]NET19865.1 IS1634 family transposase [Okeania sp. SIO1H5]NET77488.1 IS1634 family transposase [Okeania sp. SIO1F9]
MGIHSYHRPDLKQFLMELICTNDGDVPLWMNICDGNESDQKQFGGAMIELKKQLQFDSLMVAYSSFYTQENLQIVNKLKWSPRVPLTVKAATVLVKSVESNDLIMSKIPGYNYVEIKKNYAAVEQRWLLVESQKRRESDLKNLEKRIHP